jgi:hypothetical protein
MSDKPKVVALHGAEELPADFLQELADKVRGESSTQRRLADVVVLRLYDNDDETETVVLDSMGGAMSALWCLSQAQLTLVQGSDE